MAMIIGNIIMFGYVGLLGLIGHETRHELRADRQHRVRQEGLRLASGLLSTLLLGWYAVQTGITGALSVRHIGLNYVAMTVIAGLLYICHHLRGRKRAALYRDGVGAAICRTRLVCCV